MRSRPKALGTAMETRVVRRAQDAGLIAERLAEGGMHDPGDIRILAEEEWIGEVKDRERLNVHQALGKAILKSHTKNTFLVWRRMSRSEGDSRRSQDGPILVALSLDRFLELLREGK